MLGIIRRVFDFVTNSNSTKYIKFASSQTTERQMAEICISACMLTQIFRSSVSGPAKHNPPQALNHPQLFVSKPACKINIELG